MCPPADKTHERLLAELGESNRRLTEERQIFVSGPCVVFKWRNAEGWPVEYASPNAAEVFGYEPAQFVSGEIVYAELIAADDLPRVATEVREASEGGRARFEHRPYRVVRRDGEQIWLHDCTTILRNARGDITHYLGYVIDVSARIRVEAERNRLQAQLLHTQKLESLGLLAGGIAHDFNNLLTTILANAEIARGDPAARSSAEALDDVVAAAKRAAALCQQMLAYSGKGRFETRPLDLNAIVTEMAQLLGASVGKNVVLRPELHDPSVVHGDDAQIRQVVMNVLTNAAEATDPGAGGVVHITTTPVDLDGVRPEANDLGDALPAGRYVRLVVDDKGHGMDQATRSRMFEPFFSTKFAGRGLGLSAVLGILRGHGGAIRVESEEQRGTRVEVLLPASREPLPPALASGDGAPAARGRILVVDDEPQVRGVASRILERVGFEVVTAADGEQALAVFDEQADRIAAVLLDVTMPRLDGYATFAALRQRRANVRVVFMSGYDEIDVGQRIAGARPAAFLPKPFDPATLIQTLSDAVRKSPT
ncbi:MAG: response regulator [Planctomycetota bacterium]